MLSAGHALRGLLTHSESAKAPQPTAEDLEMLKTVEDHLSAASKTSLDYGVQIELANLIRLITKLCDRHRYDLLPFVDAAISSLSSDPRTTVFSQHARWQLDMELGTPLHMRPKMWLQVNSPPANVMLGLIADFAVVIIVVTIAVHFIGQYLEWSNVRILAPADYYLLGIADFTKPFSPLIMLLLVCLSGLSGSCISIMSRINEFAMAITVSPLVLFLTGLLKPIIGLGSAIFIYAALNAGFVSLPPIPNDKAIAAWAAISFVAGFSERLVPDVVQQLEKLLGSGDPSAQGTHTKQPAAP